jgi:hypothetical protein
MPEFPSQPHPKTKLCAPRILSAVPIGSSQRGLEEDGILEDEPSNNGDAEENLEELDRRDAMPTAMSVRFVSGRLYPGGHGSRHGMTLGTRPTGPGSSIGYLVVTGTAMLALLFINSGEDMTWASRAAVIGDRV